MEVEEGTFDQWDSIGLRAAFGQMLLHLATSDPKLFALSADLGRSSGLDRFASTYPERYIGTGIAEQNMVGVAAGLASLGLNVFASSFAPFLTMRASDQVRMNLGYMGIPVTLVGLASGLSLGFLGSSHYGLEDLSVMASIPGIEIVSPADSRELFAVLVYASTSQTPLYIRLTGTSNLEKISAGLGSKSPIKQVNWLRPANDGIAIATSGVLASTCQKVAERVFAETGIRIGVLQANWLRPFNSFDFTSLPSIHTWFSVEEHSIRGGLGNEIALTMQNQETNPPKVSLLGIQELFPRGSTYQRALIENGLDENSICNKILLEIRK